MATKRTKAATKKTAKKSTRKSTRAKGGRTILDSVEETAGKFAKAIKKSVRANYKKAIAELKVATKKAKAAEQALVALGKRGKRAPARRKRAQ